MHSFRSEEMRTASGTKEGSKITPIWIRLPVLLPIARHREDGEGVERKEMVGKFMGRRREVLFVRKREGDTKGNDERIRFRSRYDNRRTTRKISSFFQKRKQLCVREQNEKMIFCIRYSVVLSIPLTDTQTQLALNASLDSLCFCLSLLRAFYIGRLSTSPDTYTENCSSNCFFVSNKMFPKLKTRLFSLILFSTSSLCMTRLLCFFLTMRSPDESLKILVCVVDLSSSAEPPA